MKTIYKVRKLTPALTEADVDNLIFNRTLLTGADINRIVTESEIGLRPDGTPIYIFAKSVIPYSLCEQAYPVALSAASNPIIGGSRATAAGAHMELTKLKDGLPGKRFGVPALPHLQGAKDGILGYYASPECRKTSFTANNFKRYTQLLPLASLVDLVFRLSIPERHEAQSKAAQALDNDFVISGTCFTTVTANRNWQTAVHRDAGDLTAGFGAMTCLTAGTFTGGQLAFPKYRIAVDVGMQDVLLMDTHEAHGNLPIAGQKGCYERISLVFYLRENMQKVCPAKRK